MKRIIIFSVFFFPVYIFMNAQPAIDWQLTMGGTLHEVAASVRQTTDGGYIVGGYTNSTDGNVNANHGGYDFWIVKLDSTHGVQWQKTLGGSRFDYLYSISQTFDDGYILCGTSQSNDGDATGHHGPVSTRDIWIVKLDNSGNIDWQKSIGGSADDDGAYSIAQTSDSGYIVAGRTRSADGDVSAAIHSAQEDIWVIKLNASGIIVWDKVYGGFRGDWSSFIVQTKDGGYIFSGNSYSSDGDLTNHYGTNTTNDYWIVKLDSTGIIEWQKSYGGTQEDISSCIQQTFDGGYIVAGYSRSNDMDVSGNHLNSFDCWIVRLDSAGTITWQRSMGGSGNDYATSIQQTRDSGFVFSGFTYSADGDVTGSHGGCDVWIVKLSNSGATEWEKTLGGTEGEAAYSVQQTSDDGFIIAGDTRSDNGDVSGFMDYIDYWIVKLSPAGNPLPVELLDFNATMNKNKTVDITWSTASEINNDFYTIQRSDDAVNFESLMEVAGGGNSTAMLKYVAIDYHPLIGISYYRLMQTDYDGKFSYSGIAAVKKDYSFSEFNIYPNPSDGKSINIYYSSQADRKGVINIFNMKGASIGSFPIEIKKSETRIEILPATELLSGVYTLVFKFDDLLVTRRLVIK